MLQLLKLNRRSILGIDISPTSVKMIEISGKGEHRCVEAYGIEKLPPNIVDGHTIKDINVLANCIKRLMAQHQFQSKCVAVAVPDSAVITKVLQVNNALDNLQIEEFILMEAYQYIPYSIEEINLDFQILGPSINHPDLLDVLIVASRSENVSSRVEAIIKAGLKANIVDVESFAVERVVQLAFKELPLQGKDKTVAVFDVNSLCVSLFIMHGMKTVFTREERFVRKALIDELVLPESPLFEETLLLHVKRALQFFFSTTHHDYVDHILLSGSTAKIPKLADFIQEKTGIPATLINPLKHLRLSKKISASSIINDAPRLMLACGLALRKIE